jgi:hypothetical protein
VTTLRFPLAHAVHSPPSSPENPVLQAHAVIAELPTAEDEFCGHNVQAPLDGSGLNVSARQAVHAPSSPGVWPILHWQVLLPGGVNLFWPHSVQTTG